MRSIGKKRKREKEIPEEKECTTELVSVTREREKFIFIYFFI